MKWSEVRGKRRAKLLKHCDTTADEYQAEASRVFSRVRNRLQQEESNVDGGMQVYYIDPVDMRAYDPSSLMVVDTQPYCMCCYSGWHDCRFPGHCVGLVNDKYLSSHLFPHGVGQGPRNYHPEVEALMKRYPTLFREESCGFSVIEK